MAVGCLMVIMYIESIISTQWSFLFRFCGGFRCVSKSLVFFCVYVLLLHRRVVQSANRLCLFCEAMLESAHIDQTHSHRIHKLCFSFQLLLHSCFFFAIIKFVLCVVAPLTSPFRVYRMAHRQ